MSALMHKDLSYTVIGAAMEVHGVLGPGYLEAVYQGSLAKELTIRCVPFEQFKRLMVTYKGSSVGDYIADFLIDSRIILEIKAVSAFHPKHQAQAINYLTTTGLKLAILLNFGAKSLEWKRVVR